MPLQQLFDLDFNAADYKAEELELDGETIRYRAYRNVVYVARPQSIEYESMNIFIPEGYFGGEAINGYTMKSAPIFLPNNVGGYMPGSAGEPSANDRMSGTANSVRSRHSSARRETARTMRMRSEK